MGFPPAQGLYDPRNEHDACGVGFIANIKGSKSHATIERGLEILVNLDHRGAVGARGATRRANAAMARTRKAWWGPR